MRLATTRGEGLEVRDALSLSITLIATEKKLGLRHRARQERAATATMPSELEEVSKRTWRTHGSCQLTRHV